MRVTFTAGERRKNYREAQREDAEPEHPVSGLADRFKNMKEETGWLVNVA